MAIKRPDIYEHNNPNNAFVDSDFVRGGFRTSAESLQELFNLDVKSDQLKEYATFVYVKSEEKVFTLVDKDNIGNINGWSTSVVVSGTSIQSDWEQQDSQEGDYIKNKPTKTSDFKNDGEDGTAPYLTVTDVYRQNAILRGEYYHIEDFNFFFWADLYVINNTVYDNYISEYITLEPSDPIYDRIDVVVVNNNETISVITGTPSSTPVKPSVDSTTQVEFTFFLVKAGSTTIDDIETLVVYDENLQIVGGETNTSKNTTRVTLDSNEQSYSGDISVKYQSTQIGDKSTYRFDSLQNLSEYSKIIFFVYQDLQQSGADNAGKMRFNVVFKTHNSNTNIRVYNTYVYYENVTNEWSPLILTVDGSTIGYPSHGEDFLFDSIEIVTLHNGLTFFIDYIILQSGNPITQPFLIERTSQIPINDGNTGDSRYVEEKDLKDVIIKKYYDNISDMIYDQPNQTKGQLLIVKDAIADSNLEFSSGETRRQATYQYEETTTGTIADYKVLAVPFGGISGGGGGDMMSSMYDPTGVEGDAFDFDNFYNVPEFEKVVNRRENLNNPDHLTYPTTKAVLDAISSSGGGDMLKSEYDPTNTEGDVFDFTNMHSVPPFLEDAPEDGKIYGRKDGDWEEIEGEEGISEVETNDTDDILLTGEGTSQTPLEAELTQAVKMDIVKGVDAFGWGPHYEAGYEEQINKVNNLDNPNSTTYPTTEAVKTAIEEVDLEGFIQEGQDSEETIKYLSITEEEGIEDDTIYFVAGHEIFDYGQLDIKKFPGNVEEFAETGDRVEGFVKDTNEDYWYMVGKYVSGDEMLLESYEIIDATLWQ